MNILITGGAGFIGTNLIIKLLKDGHSITSIDNYYTGLKSNHQPGVNYIEYDIKNINDYNAFGKFDVVYHLAAMARIQPSFESPQEYFESNALATMKIAKYCSSNNIPLVFAGSSSHHSGKFKNPYTFSKDIAEEIIKLYQTHYSLKATVARFYNVYGPYHLKDGAYCTLIGKWESNIEKGNSLVIYGDGSKRRDFTHVADIVNALVMIPEKSAWNYVFELGRGKNYSVKEVSEMYNMKVVYAEDKPGEAHTTLCIDKLATEVLNWKPELNLEDYIKKYLYENKFYTT